MTNKTELSQTLNSLQMFVTLHDDKQYVSRSTSCQRHKPKDMMLFVCLFVYFWGSALLAGLCAGHWHRHHSCGRLAVLGVGFGRAVARLLGGGVGRDLHPLAAPGGAVAVALAAVPCAQIQPQQPEEGGREQTWCQSSSISQTRLSTDWCLLTAQTDLY